MSHIESLFATRLYRADLSEQGKPVDTDELAASCYAIAEDDEAGQEWCEKNAYPGYTSYASLNDLPTRDPRFSDLKRHLDRHVAAFAKECAFDLDGKKLKLDSLWVNILKPGGGHTGHIHPHAFLSGTVYVEVPDGASALKLEDPRLPFMMARPGLTDDAPEAERPFVYLRPQAGTVLMWESWLRHEVPTNLAKADRISISFNYA